MTEFSNNPDMGTGMTVDQAATAIEGILDFGDLDTETTDTNVEMDETTNEAETTFETEEDQPELESETEEFEEEVSTEEAPTFNDDTEIDFGDSKVSLKELKAGYLRQSDYTKKTQELAVIKQEVEGSKVGLRNEMLNGIQAIKHNLATEFGFNYANVNWQELKETDVYEYAEKREAFERFEGRVQELHAIEMQARQANIDAEMEAFRRSQQTAREELVAKHSVFADPETAKPVLRGMANLLKAEGFSKDEIEGIADSRILDLVYRLYQSDQASKAVPKAKAVIAQKPKASVSPVSKSSRSNDDYAKFQKSGSVEDAAKLIQKLLD